VTISETQPTIQAPGLAGDPFALPFSIRNNSAFFPMVDAEWLCGIDHITNEQGGGLSNLSLEYAGKTTIPIHGVMLGRCPVRFTGKIQATIIPIIKYKTLGIQRTYESMVFTWLPDAQPPQWIAGKPIQ